MVYTIDMLFSTKPDIKESIISLLAKGPVDSIELQKQVSLERGVTKQGFYKALRELLVEEVVIKNKQIVLLNTVWVNKLQGFINNTQGKYLAQTFEQILSLSDGDTMVFKFKSISDLDLLWMHYFYMFAKNIDAPVLFFSTHEFWSLFRSDLQNEMYQWIYDNNKKTYYVIGSQTPLDISTTKSHKKYGIEFAYDNNVSLKDNAGLTVIGDYVFNTVIDANTTKAIDSLYKKYMTWEPAVEQELHDIISRMRRSKVVIERNKKKAEQIRKKLMKYFVFYK